MPVLLLPLAVLAALLAAYFLFWKRAGDPLVVYCAHDSVYSEPILRQFEAETGIPVVPVFDTEATKSLGLIERLIREKDAPRCDVFWNNELLGTLDLAERGITLPYKGSGHARIPDKFKDPDGHWTGFAARFRVWIVNLPKLGIRASDAHLVAGGEALIKKALEGDLARVAIAKPIYGTTLTHYTVLWHRWGADKLKAWHKEWRQRGVVEARGNAHVKDLVADGTCILGLTDTDDYFLARDAGKPVAMVPATLDDGSTICIPNTVCIVRGTRRLEQAQRLVDYLLSKETELALARSPARQMPLGDLGQIRHGGTVLRDTRGLTLDVQLLAECLGPGYALSTLGPARAECLAWLKSEYGR
ncbi:MAG: extracellular solute-binding protein [Planctomycetes bacterium]|nr:extracellular solute-binding protein [Planctomycetota bacterium]